MPRYIDADRLLKELSLCVDRHRPINSAMQTIEGLAMRSDPNVVKVVKCKACKWWSKYGGCNKITGLVSANEDSYCSRGERKEETDDS